MSALNATPEGAGRYDNVHGDEHLTLDVESFERRAIEDVVETIMLFGQYPQPRGAWDKRPPRSVEFDLQEYLVEHRDDSDLANLAMCAIINFGDFDERRLNENRKLEAELTEHLRDSQIVRDRAEDLAEEDRYDHE